MLMVILCRIRFVIISLLMHIANTEVPSSLSILVNEPSQSIL